MPSVRYLTRDLFFEDMGEGTPLIFIHPPGMGRVVFSKQHKLRRHFRLIMVDLSGHGDSISSENYASMDTYVEEIKAVLDSLHLSTCIVVGYSAGGIVAQKFACTYKDRVSSLILIGGYPKVTNPKLKMAHLIGMKLVRRHPNLLTSIISKAHTDTKLDRSELTLHMKKANPDIWYHFYKQSLHFDGIKEVEKLDIPLLLIYGEKSDWINDQLKCYKNCYPKKVIIIPGATHQIPTRYHDSLNTILKGEVEELVDK